MVGTFCNLLLINCVRKAGLHIATLLLFISGYGAVCNTLQSCPSYNILKKTHWPMEMNPPANMSQLQPVEEDHWPVETPCRHVPATTC